MTDRDRLIELIQDIKDCNPTNWHKPEFMADSLLSNGVIVPPCKVRDRLYAIFNNKVVKGIAESLEIVIEENEISYIVGLKFFKGITMWKGFVFGRNIFLTKEEAEEMLKELTNESTN